MRALTVLLAAALAVAGCGPAVRGLPVEHAELVAWYIEDVAHGTARRSQELELAEPTPAMERIAAWAAGSEVRGVHAPPHHLATRLERWSVLRTLLRSGMVVVLDSGLVAARPGLERGDLDYVLPLVDAENHDRRSLDALILTISEAGVDETRRYRLASVQARLRLDEQAGARRWPSRR
jgi:hypothetical protein